MGNFNRNKSGRDFKRGGFGGRDRDRDSGRGGFRDRDSGRPEMFKTVCDACGNDCEVPFRPTSGKPVYCSDCFGQQNGGSNSRGSDRGRDRDRSSFRDRDKEMFSAVCDTCGQDCQVPFRPTSGKPVYCDNCFGKGDSSSKGRGKSDNNAEQFAAINAKLDKIIRALGPAIVEPKEIIIKEKKSKSSKKEKASKKEKTEPTAKVEKEPVVKEAKKSKAKTAKKKSSSAKATADKAAKKE